MAEQELKALHYKRGSLKTQLTLFEKFLSKLDRNNLTETQVINLQDRLCKMESLMVTFEQLQTEIEILQENDESQLQERESFQDSYYDLISLAKGIFNQYKQNDKLEYQSADHTTQLSNQNSRKINVKLPTITLPSFDGTFTMWREFHDSFKSLIDLNNELSRTQKLTYLKASLKGEPAALLRSYETTDENYDIAWSSLQKRYNNKRRIVNNHVKTLLEMPSVTRDSCQSLRELINTTQSHLQCLKTLDQPVDSWNALLIPIIMAKLDISTLKDWEAKQNTNENSTENLPTITEFLNFLIGRQNMLETITIRKSTPNEQHKINISHNRSTNVLATINTSCVNCSKAHFIQNCEEFLKLSAADRCNKAKELKLCLNCLRKGHFLHNCQSKSLCKTCKKRHHTTLHLSRTSDTYEPKEYDPNTSSKNSTTEVVMNCTATQTNCQILLSTARVHAFDSHNCKHDIRVLLDSASQSNFITEDTCRLLNLKREIIDQNVSTINESVTKITHKVQITIKSKANNFTTTLTCLVLPQIVSNLPSVSFDSKLVKVPPNIKLADPTFFRSQSVDMLIGASIFYDLLCIGQIQCDYCPILQKTKLGWVVSGPLHCQNSPHKTVSCVTLNKLHETVEKFWNADEFNTFERKLTIDEEFCENHFVKNTTRNETGEFVVKIPFKENLHELGNSRSVAENRFYTLEKRFNRNENYKSNYTQFMNEYEALNHMTQVDDAEISFFLPHHAVLRESSETTKLRVVFDGSCKLDFGLNINDLQYNGPPIQNEIISIIARFRTHPYVLIADIQKMYRCIKVHPDDRKYQGILWRNNSNENLQSYQLNTVTYGTTAAPFLAIRCLHELARENEQFYPTEACIIRQDFYVDDMLTGAKSLPELKNIKINIDNILKSAGFHLRKWASNVNNIELAIPEESTTNKEFLTLGFLWNSTADTFSYNIPDILVTDHITKRTILSETSKLFDPLGLLAPVIITAKLLIQQLWQLNVTWDESVPSNLQTKWLNFANKLKCLKQIAIPRHMLLIDSIRIELHAFSDASEKGYGACIYLRSINSHLDIMVKLLVAKSRVAPLKSVSLPRLELNAAVLAAQLAHKFKSILDIEITQEYYWCDSQIALHWIQSPPTKWKTYVANRTSEIQRLSNPNHWRYIQSADNVADLISRGTSPDKLQNLIFWWEGPHWLSQCNESWPNYVDAQTLQEFPEANKQYTVVTTVTEIFPLQDYSSLNRLKRIIAWCMRFKNNCLLPKDKRKLDSLSVTELSDSISILVKVVQKECFSKEILSLQNKRQLDSRSNLLSLTPFLDTNGILRVGGRLQLSQFFYDKRHPILLPKNHHFTKLVFNQEHRKLHHAGPKLLLSSIREQFWPISGKAMAKRTVRNCVRCFRYKPQVPQAVMGSLPAQRMFIAPPFHSTGVDYAGPFPIKDKSGRGCKIIKCYLCVFVCFSTKASHLELVTSLSTDAFLSTLRRFLARRGKPLHIFSDNGTNFHGANNKMKAFKDLLRRTKPKIEDFTSNEGINWHFIPPNSPHFGGLWEANVRSVKHHLNRVLHNEKLTYEELQTVLVQIESILNSRPLTQLSSDPNDTSALTPAHFLIGRSFTTIPEPNLIDIPVHRLSRYQHMQQLVQHFWSKWSKEYLHELQQRSKWKQPGKETVALNQLVLLKEENLPPSRWALGRIIELHPGADNITRVVSVRCNNKVYKRSISKICVLPIDT